MVAGTKSPLTAAPLRVAGQSLDEQIDDTLLDGLVAPFGMALFAVVLAGLEWWRYVTNAKPAPWTARFSHFALWCTQFGA